MMSQLALPRKFSQRRRIKPTVSSSLNNSYFAFQIRPSSTLHNNQPLDLYGVKVNLSILNGINLLLTPPNYCCSSWIKLSSHLKADGFFRGDLLIPSSSPFKVVIYITCPSQLLFRSRQPRNLRRLSYRSSIITHLLKELYHKRTL